MLDPLPQPCSSLFILSCLSPPPHVLALMISYHIPSQKKFQDAYEFLNEKSRSEKGNELLFVNLTNTIILIEFNIYMEGKSKDN